MRAPETMFPFQGLRVTVMGLGLHGGGSATVRYLHEQGAVVTVTDLRDSDTLAPSVEKLPQEVRAVLGEHREEDFVQADLVVKNPAIPRTAPLLALAPAVTTDIALFLAHWLRNLGSDRGPLVAITGTKGKSSTAAAAAAILTTTYPGTRLGGNITISPLEFVAELGPGDPVVLELSSFQLGDLRYCRSRNGDTCGTPTAGSDDNAGTCDISDRDAGVLSTVLVPRLAPDVAVVTTIFRDHQDYYGSMEAYVEDKLEIVRHIRPHGMALIGCEAPWRRPFTDIAAAAGNDVTVFPVPAATSADLPDALNVAGNHMRQNLFTATLAAHHLGVPREQARREAAAFTGVRHRLETIGMRKYVRFVNDTAATIPEATLAAATAYPAPVVLITGGTDKGLDPEPVVRAVGHVLEAGGTVVLLAGSATDILLPLLHSAGMPVIGPASSMWEAFRRAVEAAEEIRKTRTPTGEERSVTVLLSPGFASFGLFNNEFDRGEQFRELTRHYIDTGDVPPRS